MNGTPIDEENPYLKLIRPAIETAKEDGLLPFSLAPIAGAGISYGVIKSRSQKED